MVSTRFYTATLFFLIIAINQFLLVSTAPLERRIIGASELLQDVKGKLFSGSGTYYEVGSGSCGEHDTDSELVVAMNKAQMDNGKRLRVHASVLLEYLTPAHLGSNPNNNPKCDKMVSITGDSGTVTAKVVDTCPACANGKTCLLNCPSYNNDESNTLCSSACRSLGHVTYK